ncbi:MAG: cobalamin B12-binding domain-containing protein [Pseudomonadota bacterium]
MPADDVSQCLIDAVESDILPRLLKVSLRAETAAASAPGEDASPLNIPPPDIEHFCRILLDGSLHESFEFVEDLARRGLPVAQIYTGPIAGAARLMGRMWEEDRMSFVDVTLGISRLHMILRRFSTRFGRRIPDNGRSVPALFAVTPGETHALGLVMIADFFAREGFETRVEIDPTMQDLVDAVRDPAIRLVGLSATISGSLPVMKRTIAALRQAVAGREVAILAGGAAFTEIADTDIMARDLGADQIVTDIDAALDMARRLVD